MIVSCDAASSSRSWAAPRRVGRSSLTGTSRGSILPLEAHAGFFLGVDCRPTGELLRIAEAPSGDGLPKPSTPWTQGQNDEISTTPISGSGSRRAAMPTVSSMATAQMYPARPVRDVS